MNKLAGKVIKKVLMITIFTALIFAGYSLCSKAYADALTGTVNSDIGVNMREKPTVSSNVLCTIPDKAKVEITGETDAEGRKWYKVKYSAKSGYAAAEYIIKDESSGGSSGGSSSGGHAEGDFTNTYGLVKGSDIGLNVRTGPGAGYEMLGSLFDGSQVKVNGEVTNSIGQKWYEIVYAGKKGFVISTYVELIEVPPYVPDGSFEDQLSAQGFPESYKVLLRQIHAQYPNWIFTAGKTDLDWNFTVTRQYDRRANTIQNSFPDAWKSLEKGDYDFSTGKYVSLDSGYYVAASKEIIAYYMDPRNFLNTTDIFQFISTKYNSSLHTASGLQAMLNGSFMAGAFPEPTHKTYNDVLMEAAGKSGVSPYTLATMILQEQGHTGYGGSISGREPGFEGYFNHFNIRAYASGGFTAVQYGLLYAKDRGWDTRAKSIIEGSQWFSANYVNNGQYTQYLKKFNVMKGANNVGYGQYMTNVSGAYQEGAGLKSAYSASLNTALVFEIPVYTDMPSAAAPLPGKTGNNNNFLDSISVDGKPLTPKFDRFTYSYTVDAGAMSSITLSAKANDLGAKIEGTGQKKLKAGTNRFDITVTSSSGKKRVYTVNVKSTAAVDISSVNAKLSYTSIEYDGTAKTPQVIIDGLKQGVDFDVTYANNIAAGTATVTVTGKGSYTGTIKLNFTIIRHTGLDVIFGARESVRIYGDNRFATAIETAEAIKKHEGIDSFDTIIVANGMGYADALSGSSLADVIGAPILLVTRGYEQYVADYINANLSSDGKVIILGGTTAVADTFASKLKTAKVTRLAGSDRYETNLSILKYLGASSGEMLVCTGTNYADSLSASSTGYPIFLVGASLSENQKAFLNQTGFDYNIIGGEMAVSKEVERQLAETGVIKQRLDGVDRYETSAVVADTFSSKGSGAFILASGKNFPDGLVGGVLGYFSDAPIILADENSIVDAQTYAQYANIKRAIVLGGHGIISDSAVHSILHEEGRK